jgi:nitrilase
MTLRVALGQIAPAWLQREVTLEKILARLEQAAGHGAQLAVFGEALLPGYPFWPELTDGARFDSADQKEVFAHYARQAVDIDGGQLDPLCRRAAWASRCTSAPSNAAPSAADSACTPRWSTSMPGAESARRIAS